MWRLIINDFEAVEVRACTIEILVKLIDRAQRSASSSPIIQRWRFHASAFMLWTSATPLERLECDAEVQAPYLGDRWTGFAILIDAAWRAATRLPLTFGTADGGSRGSSRMRLAPLAGSNGLRTPGRAIRLAADRDERPFAFRAAAKFESRVAKGVIRQGLELLHPGVCRHTGPEQTPVSIERVLDARLEIPLLAPAQQVEALL